MAEVADAQGRAPSGEDEQSAADKALHDALSVIPNLPLDEVPDGADENGNKEVRTVGKPPKLAWINKPKQHFEIGEALGLMDFETAAKLSGARFVLLKGRWRGWSGRWRVHARPAYAEKMLGGYTEVMPPLLVRDEAMFGTAQSAEVCTRISSRPISRAPGMMQHATSKSLRRRRKDMSTRQWRRLATRQCRSLDRSIVAQAGTISNSRSDFWLIPTAEVSLTNLVRESILDEASCRCASRPTRPASAPRPARRARTRAA